MMRIGMVAHLVAVHHDAPRCFRTSCELFTDHEKRGFHTMFLENVENLWCVDGMRAVVEVEGNGARVGGDVRNDVAEKIGTLDRGRPRRAARAGRNRAARSRWVFATAPPWSEPPLRNERAAGVLSSGEPIQNITET